MSIFVETPDPNHRFFGEDFVSPISDPMATTEQVPSASGQHRPTPGLASP
jgi:hypothetical protein